MSIPAPNSSDDYFYTPELKGLVQQLVHMAFFGEGLSVVKGAKGSGKSRLAGELQTYLDQAHQVASLELTEETALPDCMDALMKVLGIASSEGLSVGESLSELRHYCQALAQDKKLAILIIDNAHYLDDQAIGALVSLLQGKGDANVGLHLLFFSEPGLDHRIDALQIVDVAVYDFTVPEFSPSEMAAFLEQQSSDSQELSPSELQKIWASSKGMPGIALAQLASAGEDSSTEESLEKKDFKFAIPMGHVAAVLLLAGVLFYSLTFREGDSDASDSLAEKKPTATPLTSISDDTIQNTHINEEVTEDSKSGDLAAKNTLQASPEVLPDKPITSVEPRAGNAPQNDSQNTVSEIEPNEGVSSRESNVEDNATNVGESETKFMNVAPTPEPTAEPKVLLRPAPIPSVAPAKVVHGLNNQQVELTEQEVFLMAQAPTAYAIQVVAAGKRESLLSYISRQPNKDSLRLYRGWRKQKVWYVVVEGVYLSRDMASNAVKRLPREQAKAGAWPRKLSSIQEEIEIFRLNSN